MVPNPVSIKRDGPLFVGGMLMGAANIVPGVSGGTVALILGFYARLVTAISRVDLTLTRLLRTKAWRQAAEHLDLWFLSVLAAGNAAGILGLATLMHYLLVYQRTATYAAFFGLIIGSSVLVGRMVRRWHISSIVCLLGATGFAFVLVGLPALSTPPEGLLYLFVCGVVSICAMILPGISGSFVLLIMGKYELVTGILRDLVHGEVHRATVLILLVFAAGCVVGLLAFAKLLRWLLIHFESQTLAFLCGLMLGSLRKLWPFPEGLPAPLDATAALALTIAVCGAAAVFLLDWLAQRRRSSESASEADGQRTRQPLMASRNQPGSQETDTSSN
ncbi:MAG: DUF368 domain-containing protein [Planctomycetes bacterium]|nr:DUF368 domain-containing protein [Planctomycetota bacterium]